MMQEELELPQPVPVMREFRTSSGESNDLIIKAIVHQPRETVNGADDVIKLDHDGGETPPSKRARKAPAEQTFTFQAGRSRPSCKKTKIRGESADPLIAAASSHNATFNFYMNESSTLREPQNGWCACQDKGKISSPNTCDIFHRGRKQPPNLFSSSDCSLPRPALTTPPSTST